MVYTGWCCGGRPDEGGKGGDAARGGVGDRENVLTPAFSSLASIFFFSTEATGEIFIFFLFFLDSIYDLHKERYVSFQLKHRNEEQDGQTSTRAIIAGANIHLPYSLSLSIIYF